MLINKTTKVTTQFKGDIYSYWNTNGSCDRLGIPTEINYSLSKDGVSGEFMRFSRGQKITDVYASTFGTVELEGSVRNAYHEQGGFNRLGFIRSTNNTYNAKCGQTGIFNNLQRGRMYQTEQGWSFVLSDTGVGSYFFSNGSDNKFGIPVTNVYSELIAEVQEFSNVFIYSKFGNTWEERYTNCDGALVAEVQNTPSCDPWQKLDAQGNKCVNKCNEDEKYENDVCVKQTPPLDKTQKYDISTSKLLYEEGETIYFYVHIDDPAATEYVLYISTTKENYGDVSLRKEGINFWWYKYPLGVNQIDAPPDNIRLLRSNNPEEKYRELYYLLEVHTAQGIYYAPIKSFVGGVRYVENKKVLGFETKVTRYDQNVWDCGGINPCCIPSYGCALTTISMILQYYDIYKNPTEIFKLNGNTCYNYWNIRLFSDNKLKLTYVYEGNFDTVIRHSMENNSPVIAFSPYIPGLTPEHFVVVFGYTENSYIVYDSSGYNYKELPKYVDGNYIFQTLRIVSNN